MTDSSAVLPATNPVLDPPAWVRVGLSGPPLPIGEKDIEAWSRLVHDGNLTLEGVVSLAMGRVAPGRGGAEPFAPSPTLQLMAFLALLACETIGVVPVPIGEFAWKDRYQALEAPGMLANVGPELRIELVQILTAALPEARLYMSVGDADMDLEVGAAIFCYQRLLVRLFLTLLGFGPQQFDQENEASLTSLFGWMFGVQRTSAYWLGLAHGSLAQQLTTAAGMKAGLGSGGNWYAAQVAAALNRRPDDYDPALLAVQIRFLRDHLTDFGIRALGVAVRRLQSVTTGPNEAIELLVRGVATGSPITTRQRLKVTSQAELSVLRLVRDVIAADDSPGMGGVLSTLDDIIEEGVEYIAHEAEVAEAADQASRTAWVQASSIGSNIA